MGRRTPGLQAGGPLRGAVSPAREGAGVRMRRRKSRPPAPDVRVRVAAYSYLGSRIGAHGLLGVVVPRSRDSPSAGCA